MGYQIKVIMQQGLDQKEIKAKATEFQYAFSSAAARYYRNLQNKKEPQ